MLLQYKSTYAYSSDWLQDCDGACLCEDWPHSFLLLFMQWDVYASLFEPLIGVPVDSIPRLTVGEDELIFVEELYQVLYGTAHLRH